MTMMVGHDHNEPRLGARDQPQGGVNEPPGSLDHILWNVERKEILKALQRTGGRRTLAARLLGISRSRLYRRMDALGIVFEEPPHGHA